MTKICLVRMAERKKPGRIGGKHQKDPLSDFGHQQAQILRDRLKKYRIDAIFSSTSITSIKTASIIAEPHDLSVERCPEFLEIDLGVWEGKTKEEMKSQHPDLYEVFFVNVPPNFGDMQVTPGSETRNQVRDRAVKKLDQIVGQWKDSNILIVSHGHTIKVMICSLLGLDFTNIWKINQANCALNLFEYDVANVLFHLIGDTSHFEEKGISSSSIQKELGGLAILGKAGLEMRG